MHAVNADTRGRLAIMQAAQAVSTYYGDEIALVIADAAGMVGAASLEGIHQSEHNEVLTYLAGRLSLPG